MDTIARQTWADRPRIMKTLLTEGHIVFETIRVTKEGIAIPVEVNAYLYIQKTKRVILSVSKDITKRKKTEEALRSQAEVLRGQAELLDIAEDSIIVRDTRDRIIFWNNAAEKRYGWDRKEAMQKIVHELLVPNFRTL
jgi:PAS domain-containing protein